MFVRRPRPSGAIALAFTAALGLAAAARPAAAQCAAIDFEDLPLGTEVTTQYDGVTFSIQPQPTSCGDVTDPPVLVIVAPADGTSSGTRAVMPEDGCDFNNEWIRMVFDDLQDVVSFTTGGDLPNGSTEIRVYNTFSGTFGLIQTIVIPSNPAVRSLVTVGTPGGSVNIRRIEVEAAFLAPEGIDDLSFQSASTAPEVRIDGPGFLECVCGDTFSVTGISCDADGDFAGDRLEYRPVNDPEAGWTELGAFSSPLCSPGTLYSVNTAAVGPGTFYFRVTAIDDCGASGNDLTVVRIDQSPPGITLDHPLAGATVSGAVELCGSIGDPCGVSWSVTARLGGSGPVIDIADGSGNPCGFIGTWETGGIVPGAYVIRIDAEDACGQSSTLTRTVTVTPGASGADLDGNGVVDFEDLLMLLAAWGSMP